MYAVIMAGGKGTRFWPRSRERKPKQLLSIVGERSMLQQTVARLGDLVPGDHIVVVAGQSHGDEVRRQLPEIPSENILLEPVGRNTSACIGLAALLVEKRSPADVMVVLPADHLITDTDQFLEILRAAVELARREPALVTIGIRPTAPETGYGYIKAGRPADRVQQHHFYEVKSFHEKPNLERAQRYLQEGNFYWNSGMFVWRAQVILEAIQRYLPDLYSGLRSLERFVDADELAGELARVYPDLPSISIDFGVMEKADNVLMVPADFGWNDLGSWAALAQVWPRDHQENACRGRVLALDAHRNVVYSDKRLCVLMDVEDLIVVDTSDALLVCPKSRAQDVGKALEVMAQRSLDRYL